MMTPRKRLTRSRRSLKPPNVRQLEHWAEVCRYIDAQTMRTVWSPFPDDPPISFPLLRNMSHFKLVRHRNSDCTWQVSLRWESILRNLAKGIVEQEQPTIKRPLSDAPPFLVDYGVDTMYVNALADELPLHLLTALTDLKDAAQVAYKPILTPWLFGGVSLMLLPNGKAAGEHGGVSWGYILRNKWAEIRLRKKQVSSIIGVVHLLAESLWLNGSERSLDLMERTLKQMWGDPDLYNDIHYQVSQLHLCADIANFPLTVESLPCLVSHSLKRTGHISSQADRDIEDAWQSGGEEDDEDTLFYGFPPDEWEDEILDVDDDTEDDESKDEDTEEESDDTDALGETGENAEVMEELGGKVHWRGRRVEGFGFSPAGAISAAWYDKLLEERKAKLKKPWMQVIHEAGGLQPDMSLTRVELRYKRPLFNELEVALGHDKGARWFDDPRIALQHLGDAWGFGVGLPPEHDLTPDVTHRGWMRLAVPDPHDATRSRWPTDPVWEIIQRVPFSQGVPQPLKRAKQVKHDLDSIDAQIRGMFITRAMLREVYVEGPAQLSRELESFDDRMGEWEQQKGLNFSEDVRERARMSGKMVPYKESLVFPKKPRGRPKKSG